MAAGLLPLLLRRRAVTTELTQAPRASSTRARAAMLTVAMQCRTCPAARVLPHAYCRTRTCRTRPAARVLPHAPCRTRPAARALPHAPCRTCPAARALPHAYLPHAPCRTRTAARALPHAPCRTRPAARAERRYFFSGEPSRLKTTHAPSAFSCNLGSMVARSPTSTTTRSSFTSTRSAIFFTASPVVALTPSTSFA